MTKRSETAGVGTNQQYGGGPASGGSAHNWSPDWSSGSRHWVWWRDDRGSRTHGRFIRFAGRARAGCAKRATSAVSPAKRQCAELRYRAERRDEQHRGCGAVGPFVNAEAFIGRAPVAAFFCDTAPGVRLVRQPACARRGSRRYGKEAARDGAVTRKRGRLRYGRAAALLLRRGEHGPTLGPYGFSAFC